MTKIKFLSLSASLLLGFSVWSADLTLAQTLPANVAPPSNKTSEGNSEQKDTVSKAVVLADVSLQNAKIVSQDKNKFRMSFDIVNGDNVQPDVLVGVTLFSEDLKNIYDRKVVTEKMTLDKKGKVHKEIEYNAPDFLSGKYKLFLESETSKSLPLSHASLGDVTLSGSGKWLEVDQKNCYLTVDGEDSKKHYTPEQGVDIKPEENLTGHCDITSHFDQDVSYQPKFEVQLRGAFGDKVSANISPLNQESIKAGEKKTISFSIPKPQKPQAYDAVFRLFDSKGQQISLSVAFHYVIHGESATIQNVELDKSSYSKDETANLTFFWTVSADSFYGSRLGGTKLESTKLGISITDQNGQKCIEDFTKEIQPVGLSPLLKMEIPLKMIANCDNPKANIRILGSANQALDDLSFSSGKDSGLNPTPSKKMSSGRFSNITKLVILVIVLLLLISLFLIIRDRNKRRAVTLLVILASSMMFFQPAVARTITFDVYDYYTCARGKDPSDLSTYENYLAGFPQCWNNSTMYNIYYRWYYDPGTGNYKVGCPYDSTAVGHCLSQFPVYEVSISSSSVYAGQALVATASRTQDMLCQNSVTGGGSADVFVDGVSPTNWHVDGLADAWPYTSGVNLPTSASDVGNHLAIFKGNIASKNFWYWGLLQTETQFPYTVLSAAVNGVCGSANRTYTTETGWGTDTLCSAGNASTVPDFPAVGSSVSWICNGIDGGTSSATCTANHGESCVTDPTCSSHPITSWTSCSGSCGGGSGTRTGTCTDDCTMPGTKTENCVNNAPCCSCSASENDDHCTGTYTNSCGVTCEGTKSCPTKYWKESAP